MQAGGYVIEWEMTDTDNQQAGGEVDRADARDLGPQPLDALMSARGMDNHILVAASTAHLTHKQVQRARRGRRLTRTMQAKITEAWNKATGGADTVTGLFNYRGL
jgi:hypothetical protein